MASNSSVVPATSTICWHSAMSKKHCSMLSDKVLHSSQNLGVILQVIQRMNNCTLYNCPFLLLIALGWEKYVTVKMVLWWKYHFYNHKKSCNNKRLRRLFVRSFGCGFVGGSKADIHDVNEAAFWCKDSMNLARFSFISWVVPTGWPRGTSSSGWRGWPSFTKAFGSRVGAGACWGQGQSKTTQFKPVFMMFHFPPSLKKWK